MEIFNMQVRNTYIYVRYIREHNRQIFLHVYNGGQQHHVSLGVVCVCVCVCVCVLCVALSLYVSVYTFEY